VADSLRNQTRSPDEIVFVDDHSPDETAQILADVAASLREATHADVSILTNTTNIGQSASLNRAIAATTSDIVLILNDDDYLVVDCVDLTMRLYKEFPEIALLGATCVPFSDDEVLESEAPSAAAGHGRESFDLAIHHPDEAQRFRHASQLNMTHSGSSFRRSAWLRVGGYNPDQSARIVRFSDRDFQMRVSALFPVGISEEVPFSFWRTDSSVDAGRNS
jgi:glycosyltransferase involved in cell wall biosynthesis